MPHRCTNCETMIPDESEELFEGCRECGNQSWEYIENDESSNENSNFSEDNSQTEARSTFVESEDLPDEEAIDILQNPEVQKDDRSEENSDHRKVEKVEKIRKKLNSQYEGIKVQRKGRYEINLTELYRGNDYIIEIGEGGAYQVRKSSEIRNN
jgi:predicted  nucleic acid-binding Zn-ribbon protein